MSTEENKGAEVPRPEVSANKFVTRITAADITLIASSTEFSIMRGNRHVYVRAAYGTTPTESLLHGIAQALSDGAMQVVGYGAESPANGGGN